jgi:hypothetical protein
MDLHITVQEMSRIKELTDLMSLNIITANERAELERLQEKWLLHSDISNDDEQIKRAFKK